MRPIFTVHAGEYLLGSFIESNFKNVRVWVPSKDTGIDLLVTDAQSKKTISYQVKFSKDFLVTHVSHLQGGLKACGWWTLDREKLRNSEADFWVFVIQDFKSKQHHIVIKPRELLDRLTALHGTLKRVQTYLWVTKRGKCWETRGLKKPDQLLLANNAFKNVERDFSKYLNNWAELKKLNRKRTAST